MVSRLASHGAIARLWTIREIAAEAGVGTTTVHRALHGEPRLGGESKAKVLAAIERLNAARLPHFAASLQTINTDRAD